MKARDGGARSAGTAPPAGRPDGSVRERWRYLGRLLRLLWTLSPGAMAVNAAVTLLIGLAPLATLVALRHLVDAAVRATDRARLGEALIWVVAYAAAAAGEGTTWILGSRLRDRIQDRMRIGIQERVIARAQALPLLMFEQPEFYDQLQRIEKGIDSRLFSTMSFIFRLGNNLVTVLSLLVYVGAAHASLPLILTAGTVGSLLFRLRLLRQRYFLERKQTEPQRRLDYLAALMSGREAAAEIRLFGLRDTLLPSWEQLALGLRDERLGMAEREFRFAGITSAGQSLTFGLALLVIVYRVSRGLLSVGQYAAFVAVVQQFQMLLWVLIWDTALIDNDLRYIRDFFLYLDLSPEASGAARLPDGSLRQGILFERVRFTYPGSDRPALDGIDLQIRPGERIALVGDNGAGKTTLAKLLLGLYPPTEGRILADGTDLRDLDPVVWRRRSAAVFQEFQQYHLTLPENNAFGNLERAGDEAAIERAARLSGAAEVVATLPQGYNTLLGKEFEEGTELSLGQWQKIAVARAYLRDAEVLVLDEPTAALDARAEVEVYRQFRDVSEGKTVLLISHRLGSARLADRILVLDGGRIVEEGSHAELMRRGGVYARMLGAQAQWYA
jgi:ATP-binding cassette, subfamily B, bacterial